MKELASAEVKQLQLETLKYVSEFCEREGIGFFLYGGTLLGAVRHKGFIPWDDDIDIGMMRKDYDRFIESFNDDVYYLCTYENNNEYYYPFLKVCDNRTKLVEHVDEYGFKVMDCLGVGIDVFPFDYAPNNPRGCRRDSKWRRRLFNRVFLKYAAISGDTSPFYKKAFWKVVEAVKGLNTKESYLRAFNEITSENKESNSIVHIWGNIYFDAHWFSEMTTLEFEGIPFPVPAGWDRVLTTVYGDYSIPVVEDEIGHGTAYLK